MRLEKAEQTSSAHVTRAVGSLPRQLFALLAAVYLMTPAAVLAQQPARAGARAVKAARPLADEGESIRPSRVRVPQTALDDLRRRCSPRRYARRSNPFASS